MALQEHIPLEGHLLFLCNVACSLHTQVADDTEQFVENAKRLQLGTEHLILTTYPALLIPALSLVGLTEHQAITYYQCASWLASWLYWTGYVSTLDEGTSRLFCSPGWWRRATSSFLASRTRSSLGGEKGRRGGREGGGREGGGRKGGEKGGEREEKRTRVRMQ